MKHIYSLLLCLYFCTLQLLANTPNYVKGELLIQTQARYPIQKILKDFQNFKGKQTQLSIKKEVATDMNIWLLSFDHQKINQKDLKKALAQHPYIPVAQNNHLLDYRDNTPNDPLFDQQWQYINNGSDGGLIDSDLDIELAWDIAIGGLTALDDTIVVAIVDDGLVEGHPDFGDNLWKNYQEIPNNGLDDDNNGYVDDYLGWNAYQDTDNVYGNGEISGRGWHGTPTAGIIGAKGNNFTGVTGVNWHVKLMIIAGGGSNVTEADAIASYAYPLSMRKLYNETGGTKGAFVVATNTSWGVSYLVPEDAPLWCAMYDSLGTHGVLSVASTANINYNVDEEGDLPTSCKSDYLITVTNIDRSNQKVEQAAFGNKSIDLGAFGQEVYTTLSGSTGDFYGPFSGTSAAAPHVTGTLALMYSIACPQVALQAIANPSSMALVVKDFLMQGVDTIPSLKHITTTGGRLNTYNSLLLFEYFGCVNTGCFPPYNLQVEAVTQNNAYLTWGSVEDAEVYALFYIDEAGNTVEDTVFTTDYLATNLSPCTDYEFFLFSLCGESTSNISFVQHFTTAGCCDTPLEIQANSVTQQSALIAWNDLVDADYYQLSYRPTGGAWFEIETNNNTLLIDDLANCVNYEINIQAICHNGQTSTESNTIYFQTLGCGSSCADNEYCSVTGSNSTDEWIKQVSIADLDNLSGNNNGYGDFSASSITVEQGQDYPITLVPEFNFVNFIEYWRIWIDYNQDGNFEEIEELAFDSGVPSDQPVEATISIPSTALTGATRLRVSMKYFGEDDVLPPLPCEVLAYGEIEDYCLYIEPTATNIDKVTQTSPTIYPNPFTDQITIATNFNEQITQGQIIIFDIKGKVIRQQPLTIPTNLYHFQTNDLPSGIYVVQIQINDNELITQKMVKY